MKTCAFWAALAGALICAGGAGADIRACAATTVIEPARASIESIEPPPLSPAPANAAGCAEGVGVDAGAGVAVWRCRMDRPEGAEDDPKAWSGALLIVRDGAPTQAFRDFAMAGRYDAFHIIAADLDGDGAQERVVAAWQAQGNGLGVNWWAVRVFDADWRLIGALDDVLDWGRRSIVAAPAGRAGCDIAVTAWVEDEDPRRGEGVAFEARFLRVAHGELRKARDRAPVRRRLLNAFSAERNATFERAPSLLEGDIPAWLSHHSAR